MWVSSHFWLDVSRVWVAVLFCICGSILVLFWYVLQAVSGCSPSVDPSQFWLDLQMVSGCTASLLGPLISGMTCTVGCEWQCFSTSGGPPDFLFDICSSLWVVVFLCMCGPSWFWYDMCCSMWVALFLGIYQPIWLLPWCVLQGVSRCTALHFLHISLLAQSLLQMVSCSVALHLGNHLTSSLMCAAGCESICFCVSGGSSDFWFHVCCRLWVDALLCM